MSNWDNAIEIAQSNESGAAVCQIAPKVELLVSDRGEVFTIWNHRPNAKRIEKVVSAGWAHKFLGRAFGVTVRGFDW